MRNSRGTRLRTNLTADGPPARGMRATVIQTAIALPLFIRRCTNLVGRLHGLLPVINRLEHRRSTRTYPSPHLVSQLPFLLPGDDLETVARRRQLTLWA